MILSKKNLKIGKFRSKLKKTLKKMDDNVVIQRIWGKDSAVWKTEPGYEDVIKNRLGWLTLPEDMKKNCDEIISFVNEIKQEGFLFAVLLGMGGSSLCPEVCKDTFGIKEGYLKLFVLDSTDPLTIFHYENSIDIDKTLFIVSSKSGSTIEVDSFFKYFFDKIQKRKGADAGKQFIAITDPSTSLESLAKENHFRKIFTNPPDIGGRYSALSFFGLVPAALIGIDIKKLLNNAWQMMDACSVVSSEKNPGALLGTLIGSLAKKGKNKLTFILSSKINSFGYWVEQLIAESTGKEGYGILPVAGESLSKPSRYRNDRVFVFMEVKGMDKKVKKRLRDISKKFPVININLQNLYDIGGEFYLWEFATAIMGAVLKINPFDEPNVKESKDNTYRVLEHFEAGKKLPVQTPVAFKNNLKIYLDEKLFKKQLSNKKTSNWDFDNYLDFFLSDIKSTDYVAIMAYIENNENHEILLQKIRDLIKKQKRVATTIGYGPRFLHSTGQLHKGGPDEGVFIQLVSDDSKDLQIPDKPYSFSILKQAQALGDYEALLKWKRRVLRINLGSNVSKGLEELYLRLKKIL